ncbi:DUF4189 domain-containing protein [Neisseria sp. 23W00296]|uniref:DUF4189 domain-containing protein n=1 Tax=unclassified Neisseria TaxID=2623750 RepID=UPI001E400C10|nr:MULTISPECIES: DUF4189 domain-containing protein [unclassified Neisseria]
MGWAINESSRERAEQAALNECRKYGGVNCKIEVWVRNGCFAGVQGKQGKKNGVVFMTKASNAEAAALHECKKAGISHCQIFVPESCSIPSRSDL